MRGRILAQLALVVRGGDELAVVHDDRADRHVVVFRRALGLAQREAHEVVVVVERSARSSIYAGRSATVRAACRAPGRIIITRSRHDLSRPQRRPRRQARTAACYCSLRACAAARAACGGSRAPAAPRSDVRARTILVKYAPATPSRARAAIAAPRSGAARVTAPHRRVLSLARGVSVAAALAPSAPRARRRLGRARLPRAPRHAGAPLIPNDRGEGSARATGSSCSGTSPGPFGVNAPQAWSNVAADGAPGGKGVVVAVLDTGVAYAKHGRFRARRTSRATGSSAATTSSRTTHTRTTATVTARSSPARSPRRRTTTTGSPGSRSPRGSCPCACSTRQGEGEASTIAEGVRYAVRARRAGDQPQPRVLQQRDRIGHPRADRSAALRAPARRARRRGRGQRGRTRRSPTRRARRTWSQSGRRPNTAVSRTTPTTAAG